MPKEISTMIIWSIKLQFQVNFLLTSYKTKQFSKKVRCFLIQPEFYLNSCLVCTADCLLFAICHEQTSGNYDAALAFRSDSVVKYFLFIFKLCSIYLRFKLLFYKRIANETFSGRSPNSRV